MKRVSVFLLIAILLLAPLCDASASSQTAVPKYVVPITGIAINKARVSLSVGQTIQLLTRITPASRAHEQVTFLSSNPAVATIAPDGVVRGRSVGTAQITAQVDGRTAACLVQVKRTPIKGFRLNAEMMALRPNETFKLHVASFNPAYASENVTYSSQHPDVATVDAMSGLITARQIGQTRIEARSASGKIARCTLTVDQIIHALSVAIDPTSANFSLNERRGLTATVTPVTAVAEDKVITWQSSNPAIATVDDNGVVQAGDIPGKCFIMATTGNGLKNRIRITVKHMAVRGIVLDKDQLTLQKGASATLTAAISPINASDQHIVWTSNNEAIASVNNGVVTAHQSGVARITATCGGKSASCAINVPSIQTRVTITAAGDITIGGDIRRSANDPASEQWYEKLFAQYGGDFLGKTASAFSGSNEITLVNLECNLTTATQYKSKPYVLRGQPSYVSILKRAGIEVVGHANNHAIDYGTPGARDTRNAVTQAGMSFVTGATTAIRSVNGVDVGFCAFNQTGGNVTAAAKNVVSKLKRTCDIVVASVHWGTEFHYTADAKQRALGHALVDAGADLVVGHHSHVVSGVEKYREKYIVYGLGTLSSALVTPEDMDAILFQQTFKVDVKTGRVQSADVTLIPVSMSTDDATAQNVNDARPYILEGTARQRVLSKVKYYSKSFANTLPDNCFQ